VTSPKKKEEVVPEILIIGGGFAGVRACASIENGSVV
jgi:heterodisulfide reductase subunit A-like polyferredoxin